MESNQLSFDIAIQKNIPVIPVEQPSHIKAKKQTKLTTRQDCPSRFNWQNLNIVRTFVNIWSSQWRNKISTQKFMKYSGLHSGKNIQTF